MKPVFILGNKTIPENQFNRFYRYQENAIKLLKRFFFNDKNVQFFEDIISILYLR